MKVSAYICNFIIDVTCTYLYFQGPGIAPFPYTSLEWQLPQQWLVLQQKAMVHHQNLPSKVQRGNPKTFIRPVNERFRLIITPGPLLYQCELKVVVTI